MFRNSFSFVGLSFIFFFMNCTNNKAVNQELPEQFKKYHSIDSSNTINLENVQLSLMLQSTEEIQSFQLPNNDMIIYTIPSKTENSFYKISPSGNITDSLKINSRPVYIDFVKGFIIDKKKQQYYAWSFNGNKKPINLILQNENLDWDVQKQQQQLTEILKNSSTIHVDYRQNNPAPQKYKDGEIPTLPTMKNYPVLTYFSGNIGYQFTTTMDIGEQFSYPYSLKLMLNNIFKQVNTKVLGGKEIIISPHIKYRYFQKLKQEEVYFPGIDGFTKGYYGIIFHGNLFTDITFKNDTFRLKEFMYLDKERDPSAIRVDGNELGMLFKQKAKHQSPIEAYMYYTSPGLDYALFSNDEKKIYIIK